MSIPKKGTRKIVVRNQTFRWLIRRKATYGQSDYGMGKLHIAVELEENPSSSLFIYTDRNHPNDIFTTKVNPITPYDISNWIQQALEIGWQPSVKGIPFRTKIVNDIMKLE